jgi:hypothetical protein
LGGSLSWNRLPLDPAAICLKSDAAGFGADADAHLDWAAADLTVLDVGLISGGYINKCGEDFPAERAVYFDRLFHNCLSVI